MQTKKEEIHTDRECNFNKRSVLERIKLFFHLKNNADLARFMDVSPNTITNWYSRETFDIDKIYTKCVGVNLHWLLTGEGDMIKQNTASEPVTIYKSDPKDEAVIIAQQNTIESQKGTIDTQKELISTLKQQINDLKGKTDNPKAGLGVVQLADTSTLDPPKGKAKR